MKNNVLPANRVYTNVGDQVTDDYCAMEGQDITNHLHSRSQLLAIYPLHDSAKVLLLLDKINCKNRIQFIQKKPQYSCGRPLITRNSKALFRCCFSY
jgi:hypothetical protein